MPYFCQIRLTGYQHNLSNEMKESDGRGAALVKRDGHDTRFGDWGKIELSEGVERVAMETRRRPRATAFRCIPPCYPVRLPTTFLATTFLAATFLRAVSSGFGSSTRLSIIFGPGTHESPGKMYQEIGKNIPSDKGRAKTTALCTLL